MAFTQHILNVHWSGYSAVWSLRDWCHVKLLPPWCMFCVHRTTMYQFTVSLYSKPHTLRACEGGARLSLSHVNQKSIGIGFSPQLKVLFMHEEMRWNECVWQWWELTAVVFHNIKKTKKVQPQDLHNINREAWWDMIKPVHFLLKLTLWQILVIQNVHIRDNVNLHILLKRHGGTLVLFTSSLMEEEKKKKTRLVKRRKRE